MRVATICPHYPPHPGGVSDFTRRWARALAEQFAEVTVLTGPGAVEDHPGIRLVPHDQWGGGGMRALRDKLAAARPDVVVLQYVPHLYERRGASVGMNLTVPAIAHQVAPVVTLAHELYYGRHEGLRHQPIGWLQRAMLVPLVRGSARLVVTVPDRLHTLRARFPKDAARFRLLPVGSNLDPPERFDRAAWRAEQGLDEGELVLAFLGLAHPSKELGQLTRTLDLLAERGVQATLLVVGGGQVPHPRARNLGYLEPAEAARALAGADLFVLPLADGASTRRTSLMNALAQGLPVVSTDGANTDTALFGGAMALVPAHDAEAFAERVCELANNREERLALGQAGLALYRERFAWKPLTLAWYELLAEVSLAT